MSHHQMSTTPSGTDLNTLAEEGRDRNHFVSLIVNNAGNYTAMITRKVEVSRVLNEKITYKSFNDEEKSTVNSDTETVEEIQYFMLNIEFEGADFKSDFNKRFKEIKDKKETLLKENKYKYNFYWGNYETKQLELPFNKLEVNKPKDINKTDKQKENKNNKSFTPSLYKQDTIEDDLEILPLDIDDKEITSLVYQLITGSIIISNESKIDLDKWIKGMPSLFSKRFGKGDSGFSKFKAWAETYIEFLCWFSFEGKFNCEDDIVASEVASKLIQHLEELTPKNMYIDTFITILEGYLL